jgi:hypothetical protein
MVMVLIVKDKIFKAMDLKSSKLCIVLIDQKPKNFEMIQLILEIFKKYCM